MTFKITSILGHNHQFVTKIT